MNAQLPSNSNPYRPRLAFAAGILLLAWTSPLFAAEDQPEPLLPLEQAIANALAYNLNLRVQQIDPVVAELNVVTQEAAFDPNLFSRASVSQSDQASTSAEGAEQASRSDSRSYSAGVAKRLVTGATVTASTALNRSDGSSFNSDLNQFVGGRLTERASLGLQLSQPLLRGRGRDVSLAPLRRAQSQERNARFELRNAVAELLQLTENAYWRLADAYARRALRQTNLQLAEKLVEENSERERLGLFTQLEVLQAQASLAQRREEIIRAEQAITEAADNLQAAMGLLDEQLSISARPVVSELPTPPASDRPFDTVVLTALERNFDTAIQLEILYQLEQDLLLARDSHRPELDLTLAGAYNGLSPEDARSAYDQALQRRGEDWNVSLGFSLPWGRRATAANLQRADLRIDQAEIRLAAIKQDLLREVRTAWRNARTATEQLAAATQVVALQQASFEQQSALFEQGRSTFRQLLEAQRDLDNAQLAFYDAKLGATEAQIALARAEGTLLERHAISWDEAENRVANP